MNIDNPCSGIEIVDRGFDVRNRIALVDGAGEYSYAELLDSSLKIACALLDQEQDLNGSRVAFIVPPSFQYAAVLWGIWRAGGVAVPLCVTHPDPELDYVIRDSDADCVIASGEYYARIKSIVKGRRVLESDHLDKPVAIATELPQINQCRSALIIYTSGTTAQPKGVVSTHQIIKAQVLALVEAWGWAEHDYILNTLPLHHLHGIVNAFLCAMWSGAKCEFLPRFDAQEVWSRFVDCNYTLYMAVPTIYSKLIEVWEGASPDNQELMSKACGRMRVMISGSAALPVSTLERWEEISGQVLLERYGMTEIGIVLSNPLVGKRVAGHVGKPLRGVLVKIVDDKYAEVSGTEPGELLVKSPTVFLKYWQKPDASSDAFTEDGWFKTGDIAAENEDGDYKILGRSSVDIIKTGGYKVSALEIEDVLRHHPAISECAVVGIPDDTWGEVVCAALFLNPDRTVSPKALGDWCKERIASYKIPRFIRVVESLPKNAMGKVTKPSLKKLFDNE